LARAITLTGFFLGFAAAFFDFIFANFVLLRSNSRVAQREILPSQ